MRALGLAALRLSRAWRSGSGGGLDNLSSEHELSFAEYVFVLSPVGFKGPLDVFVQGA